MVFLFRILLVISLVKLLMFTDKPRLCAALYAAGAGLLGLTTFTAVTPLLVFTGVSFVIALAYFSLLDHLNEGSPSWWGVCLVGLPIVAYL